MLGLPFGQRLESTDSLEFCIQGKKVFLKFAQVKLGNFRNPEATSNFSALHKKLFKFCLF